MIVLATTHTMNVACLIKSRLVVDSAANDTATVADIVLHLVSCLEFVLAEGSDCRWPSL